MLPPRQRHAGRRLGPSTMWSKSKTPSPWGHGPWRGRGGRPQTCGAADRRPRPSPRVACRQVRQVGRGYHRARRGSKSEMAESLPCLPLKATWSVTRRGIATHAFIRMSLFACHMLPLAIQCMAQLQREVSTSAYGLPHMPTTQYSPGMCVLFMYSVGHRGPGLATWNHTKHCCQGYISSPGWPAQG